MAVLVKEESPVSLVSPPISGISLITHTTHSTHSKLLSGILCLGGEYRVYWVHCIGCIRCVCECAVCVLCMGSHSNQCIHVYTYTP